MKREWSWFNRIFFALFVVVLIGVIVFLASRWAISSTERAQLIEALTQSQAQLRDEGIEPEAPEPEQIVQGVVGPPGVRGEPGPRGERGEPGKSIVGPEGKAGVDGRDSTVPGPQGPAGMDSTVPGPAGRDGKDSTVPGPQGVGIASISCMDDGTWRFTMTNGTTQDVAGPCRFAPEPPEVDTPTAG